MTTMMPVKVFCSYAQEDEIWLSQLEAHLNLLSRQGMISLCHRQLIAPGTDWAQTSNSQMETASILLLLVSADFFASDYCFGIEMMHALKRHEAGEARVIPILVRAVDWSNAPFAHLQVLPTNRQPLAAWRDQDAALADVTAGLRRVITEEIPLLTPIIDHAGMCAIWNVPFSRNPFFTGREDEIKFLQAQLHRHSSAIIGQTQTISGLGGVGKTSLALEYAYRYHADYAAILWARADDQNSLNASYTEIARLLRLPEREEKEQVEIVQDVKNWLYTHQNYLLILDNADELEICMPFIPSVVGGHLLITTRSMIVRHLNTTGPLTLEMLPPEQGTLLLLHRAGLLAPDAPLVQADLPMRLQALRIYQELGGLPLALEQAGAYIEETGTRLTSYQQLYQKHRAQLLNQRQPPGYPHSVATTWTLSFSKIEQNNPIAAELLRFFAFLAPDAIPEAIIIKGGEALGPILSPIAGNAYLLNQACATLRTYSFITRAPHEPILAVHRLVQAVLRDSLNLAQQLTWAERVIKAMNKAISELSTFYWQERQIYLPQLHVCSQLIDEYNLVSQEAGQLLNRAGTMLRQSSHHPEAEQMYEQALRIDEQVLGPDHPGIAITLNNLATILGIQRKYERALRMFERLLHIREHALGPEHLDTAATIHGLAMLYSNWHRYEESRQMYERALRIRESVLGSDHPDTAEIIGGLAMLYSIWKKYEQAEPLFKRALHIYEHSLGFEHSTTSSILNRLAVLYRVQGKYEQAAPLFERALHIQEQTAGLKHPATATVISNLAYLYRLEGKYELSSQLYKQALHIREQSFGLDHPKTTITCLNIGQLYREQKAYEQAEEYIKRALSTHEQAMGTEHPKVAAILEEYAILLHDAGQNTKARQIETQILEIRSKVAKTRVEGNKGSI